MNLASRFRIYHETLIAVPSQVRFVALALIFFTHPVRGGLSSGEGASWHDKLRRLEPQKNASTSGTRKTAIKQVTVTMLANVE